MNKTLAIFELMRLDKPIGIYLLLWPALLALVISTNGDFMYSHLLIIIIGSILDRCLKPVPKFPTAIVNTRDKKITNNNNVNA